MTTSIIKVQGLRLNAKHGGELQTALAAEWASGVERVIVDCSGLEAADSLGLGALVRLMRVKPKDRHIVLREVNANIMAAIKVAHLTQIFEYEHKPGESTETNSVSLQTGNDR